MIILVTVVILIVSLETCVKTVFASLGEVKAVTFTVAETFSRFEALRQKSFSQCGAAFDLVLLHIYGLEVEDGFQKGGFFGIWFIIEKHALLGFGFGFGFSFGLSFSFCRFDSNLDFFSLGVLPEIDGGATSDQYCNE